MQVDHNIKKHKTLEQHIKIVRIMLDITTNMLIEWINNMELLLGK